MSNDYAIPSVVKLIQEEIIQCAATKLVNNMKPAMNNKSKLSERLRAGVEAAPWVIEEVKKLEQESKNVILEGDEYIGTFGGESYIDGVEFSSYGIDFGIRKVYDLTPAQAVQLVCVLADHLLLNGHEFEARKTSKAEE